MYQPILRKKRPPFWSQPKVRKQITLVMSLFGVFSLANVWQDVTVDRFNRQNGKLREELLELHGQTALLTAKIEELKRYERIAAIAQKEFGFVPAPKIKIDHTHHEK